MNNDLVDYNGTKVVAGWPEQIEAAQNTKAYSIGGVLYPRVSGLTDEWALLAASLKTIRFQFGEDLLATELDCVVELQHLAESVVYR